MNEVAKPALIAAGKHATAASMPGDRGSIARFLILAVLISGVFWVLMIEAGHPGAGGGHYIVGLMWAPAVATFLTLRLRRGDIRSLGLSSIGGKSVLLAYNLPLFYASVAYGLVWALGLGFFPDPAVYAGKFPGAHPLRLVLPVKSQSLSCITLLTNSAN